MPLLAMFRHIPKVEGVEEVKEVRKSDETIPPLERGLGGV